MIASNPISEGQLLIEDGLLTALDKYRQRNLRDSEAGGLLLGYRRGPHLHVVGFTQPFPTDRRTRTSFKRMCAGHAEIAYAQWQASDECQDYLGEWHSHPEAAASPSAIDFREWRILLRERTNPLVFMIIGQQHDWIGIGFRSTIERLASASPLRETQIAPRCFSKRAAVLSAPLTSRKHKKALVDL